MEKQSLDEQVEGLVVEVTPEEPPQTLGGRIEKSKTRRKSYVMDLRIQSPAALGYLGIDGIDTAPALVRLAKVKGLDVIAVTDFYSGLFIDRIIAAAADTPVTVIPGVVIRCRIDSCDDVVLTCLFPEHFRAAEIRQFLMQLQVPEKAAGDSRYVVQIGFAKVLEIIDQLGGVAIPSRMDKTPFRKSVIPALVERFGFRAFDLAYYPDSIQFFKSNWPGIKFNLLSFSNATALAQIGSRISKVKMSSPGFEGLRTVAERGELSAE